MSQKDKVLYSVLNWGLGHASRSIPIIQVLIKLDIEVVIASSGSALSLLKKEIPSAEFLDLPDYKISYATGFMPLNLIASAPSAWSAIKKEHRIINEFCRNRDIKVVISDNRFGTYLIDGHSIFITHQLIVPGNNTITERVATAVHNRFMQNYDEVWIPDVVDEPSLSGKLGRKAIEKPTIYLGSVSRFGIQEFKATRNKDYDWLVVLSGPEPARTKFEEIIIDLLTPTDLKVVIIRGKELPDQKVRDGFDLKGLLTVGEIHEYAEKSHNYCGRSGYSTILDLANIDIPCLLIPTPGQIEQEYLGAHLAENYNISICAQNELSVSYFFKKHKKLQAPPFNVEALSYILKNRIARLF